MSEKEEFDFVSEFLTEVMEESFKRLPVYNRLIYILNVIHLGYLEDKDIYWEKINNIILDDTSDYDYNNMLEVNSVKELMEEFNCCRMATINLYPWYFASCKTCGADIFLMWEEVKFFQAKGLKLPTHCKSCRKERKSK